APAVGRCTALAVPMLLLALLLVLALIASATFGATSVSWSSAFAGERTARAILFHIRLPRALLAALVGAALAVAGLTFQTLLRNPVADPFILGVSGGAAAGAAVSAALGLAGIPGVVPVVAFAGACGATAPVYLLARRRDYPDP